MKSARFNDILAIRTEGGKVLGFHARNLDVAHLDEAAWNALVDSAPSSPDALEARAEIEEWNRTQDPAVQDRDVAAHVRHLLVNVAQVCNLKCTYCAAGGDGSFGDPMKHVELETLYEQIRMFLHDVPRGGHFSITFFGGEPLVNPEAIRLLARYAKLQVAGREIDLRFKVITNGTLVTPEIAEMLANLRCHVTVSIDGPPEINDRTRPTRGGRGSTLLTMRGLQNLLNVKDRLGSLQAASIFGSHNTAVLATYRYLRSVGFDFVKFDFAAEANDEEASQRYVEELSETADEAFRNGGEAELRRINLFDGWFGALDEKVRLNNHCGAGKTHLTIDGKGRMSACQWFVGKAEDEVGRGTQVDHEKLGRYAGRLNEMHGCQSCWARHLCGGGCMFVNEVKTGSKHKKDAEFCNRTRNIIAKAIEHYAEARYES